MRVGHQVFLASFIAAAIALPACTPSEAQQPLQGGSQATVRVTVAPVTIKAMPLEVLFTLDRRRLEAALSQARDTALATPTALEATEGANAAAVENAKVQLQYATIRVPIAGRTGALMVNSGNKVRANDQLPLVVINQISPICVSFGIPENMLPDLRQYLAQGALQVKSPETAIAMAHSIEESGRA